MLVLVFIFSIYSASASCVVPTNGMVITEDTTFCEGEYFLPGIDDIDYSAIIIGDDNVVLDCNGATIDGGEAVDGIFRIGIEVLGYSNVVIKNCIIKEYSIGIDFWFRDFNMITTNGAIVENNVILGCESDTYCTGIAGYSLSGSLIQKNDISGCETGMVLSSSSNNFIYKNSIHDSATGLHIVESSNNELVSNNFCNLDGSGAGVECGVYSSNNSGSDNAFSSITEPYGDCGIIDYSECEEVVSSSKCGSLGGRCSSEVNPGEISIGTCEDNPPKKVIPQMQEAVGGPRFSGEMNLFDKIKYFFRGLFVKQSKLRIENVQSRSGGSDPNNCVITPLAVSDFNGTPGCLGSAVNYINLCDPNRNGVYSYDVDIESFLNYGTGISLGEGLFCSISDSSCSPVVNYNAVYPRNCNDSLNSWSIIGLEGNYSGGELNGLGVDSCISGTDVSLSCFELNEVYHKFGTDINEWRPNYDLDWALDWAGSEGVNSGNGHSWHESGYFEDKMMCGYCGDGVMGPHESSDPNDIDCNDSSFNVSLGGDEKCVCPSDVIAYYQSGNEVCESGEYDSGPMNGCHYDGLFPTSVCEYGVCENGVCEEINIPVQKPSCEGDEWYNNQSCNDPDSQCYGNSCLGGAYCDGNGECSRGNPVCCGDGVCEGLENCPGDVVGCQALTCQISTCDSGCGYEFVPEGEQGVGCEYPYQCDGIGNCEPINCDLIDCYSKIHGTTIGVPSADKCESSLNDFCCKGQTPQGVPCGASQPYCVKESDPSCTAIQNNPGCCATSGCTAQLMDGGFFGCLRSSNCESCNHNVFPPGTTFSFTCGC